MNARWMTSSLRMSTLWITVQAPETAPPTVLRPAVSA